MHCFKTRNLTGCWKTFFFHFNKAAFSTKGAKALEVKQLIQDREAGVHLQRGEELVV